MREIFIAGFKESELLRQSLEAQCGRDSLQLISSDLIDTRLMPLLPASGDSKVTPGSVEGVCALQLSGCGGFDSALGDRNGNRIL